VPGQGDGGPGVVDRSGLGGDVTGGRRWRPLAVLGAAQFLMVLDTSVMNVSISQLVEDFDTEVVAIQGVITCYSLVMAAFMITGGKLGDLWGRRRAFTTGLVIYGVGSAVTAVAPTVAVLLVGWSVVEGLGAALVLPALVALVAGQYRGRDRAVAYGVIGGLSGAGVAVGPLLGGWVTTYLTWRLVFAGEVVVVLAILAVVRWLHGSRPAGGAARLDAVGTVLSAAGMALVVLGVLQSTTWGWLSPRSSPVTVFGFSLTPFVIGAGIGVLSLFGSWERRVAERGGEPLVHVRLLAVPPLRAGLLTVLAQGFILLGLFFVIPLYLQVVLGLDAFQTGLRLLPVSVTMLAAAVAGPVVNRVLGPRSVVRISLGTLVVATLALLSTVEPQLRETAFAVAMGLLGAGMGLLASQVGNVVQSSVDERSRSEAGGLQYTAQNLGMALGTALMGSIVLGGLGAAFSQRIAADPRIPASLTEQLEVRISAGLDFVPTAQVQAALARAGVPPAEAQALLEQYAAAQLAALKAALLVAAAVILASFWFTRHLPTAPLGAQEPEAAPAVSASRP
jgi:MFS family permease